MSQRAHPGLSGLVHASLALLDEVWLIEPRRGLAAFHALRGVTWSDHARDIEGKVAKSGGSVMAGLLVTETGVFPMQARDANGNRKDYALLGSVAVIEIEGPMQKQEAWSMDGTSTIRTRRAVRSAVSDESVESILLIVDSPGGTVSGTFDLAMDVRAAAGKKPVYAYCSDMCCSAAYYVASQANAVYASKDAMVGSIGVYATIYDMSAMAEAEGVIVHVVKDGDQKGDFMPGTPVTADQLARMQSIVDTHGALFRKTVSETRFPGKPLQKGQSPADGGVFMGAEARRAGLVDGITSLDNVLAAMKKKKKP